MKAYLLEFSSDEASACLKVALSESEADLLSVLALALDRASKTDSGFLIPTLEIIEFTPEDAEGRNVYEVVR